jgi:hypothetical protein
MWDKFVGISIKPLTAPDHTNCSQSLSTRHGRINSQEIGNVEFEYYPTEPAFFRLMRSSLLPLSYLLHPKPIHFLIPHWGGGHKSILAQGQPVRAVDY